MKARARVLVAAAVVVAGSLGFSAARAEGDPDCFWVGFGNTPYSRTVYDNSPDSVRNKKSVTPYDYHQWDDGHEQKDDHRLCVPIPAELNPLD